MPEKLTEKTRAILNERFHKDSLVALATVQGTTPWVRTVDGFYEEGCFYVITYELSNKMKQIRENPQVALSGEWFTAHGIGESLGHVLAEENKALADKLRKAFAAWYGEGDVNERDPNTCILRIRLTDGVLMSMGTRYDLDFTKD